MSRAFQYGAPPHGGMAAGVDRIVMLLCGATNLREISLFPMNQQAVDLLMGAPSEVTPKQLRELHIRLNLPESGAGHHPGDGADYALDRRGRPICRCTYSRNARLIRV